MELLNDPYNDRKVPDVVCPPHRPLDSNLLFPKRLNGLPDWEVLRDHLKAEGRIRKQDFIKIIKKAQGILCK